MSKNQSKKETRRALMEWALGGVSTQHLLRLKALGENVCQMTFLTSPRVRMMPLWTSAQATSHSASVRVMRPASLMARNGQRACALATLTPV